MGRCRTSATCCARGCGKHTSDSKNYSWRDSGNITDRVEIDPADLDLILDNFKLKTFQKGQIVLRQGRQAKHFYFVDKGCLRIFIKHGDKDITGWLATEHVFFGELSSLNSGLPSEYNIEAIEKTDLYVISKNDMDKLYRQIPQWQEFGRKNWEQAFTTLVRRVVSHQKETAEQRYEHLLNHTELLQRVPLKHLATYLGVTPSSLSQLRKQQK